MITPINIALLTTTCRLASRNFSIKPPQKPAETQKGGVEDDKESRTERVSIQK